MQFKPINYCFFKKGLYMQLPPEMGDYLTLLRRSVERKYVGAFYPFRGIDTR